MTFTLKGSGCSGSPPVPYLVRGVCPEAVPPVDSQVPAVDGRRQLRMCCVVTRRPPRRVGMVDTSADTVHGRGRDGLGDAAPSARGRAHPSRCGCRHCCRGGVFGNVGHDARAREGGVGLPLAHHLWWTQTQTLLLRNTIMEEL